MFGGGPTTQFFGDLQRSPWLRKPLTKWEPILQVAAPKPKAPPSRAVLDAAALREVPWISVDGVGGIWGDFWTINSKVSRTDSDKQIVVWRADFFQMLEEKL